MATSISGQILDTAGRGVFYTQISVFDAAGINRAPIFKENTLNTPLSSVFLTDANGNYGPVYTAVASPVVRAAASGHTFLDGTAATAPFCTIDPFSQGGFPDRANTEPAEINAGQFASLNDAVNAVYPSSQTKIVITTPMLLVTSLTIPANITIDVRPRGQIIKQGTSALVINGYFMAGLHQVFFGFSPGDITFGPGSVKEVYPEWWGASKYASGAVNNLANSSAFLAGNTIKLSQIYPLTGSGFTISNVIDYRITGEGGFDISAISSSPASPYYLFKLSNVITGLELDHIRVVGSGNASGSQWAIFTDSGATISDVKIHDNRFELLNATGAIGNATSGTFNNSRIYANHVENMKGSVGGSAGYGFVIQNANNTMISNNTFVNCNRHAIYCSLGNVNGTTIIGNTIRQHRSDLHDGAWYPAIVIARVYSGVVVSGNTIADGYGGGLDIGGDPSLSVAVGDVLVSGNAFVNGQELLPDIWIEGRLDASTGNTFFATNILITNNYFSADASKRYDAGNGFTRGNIRIVNAKNINIHNNIFHNTGINNYAYYIEVGDDARMNSGADVDYTSIRFNTFTSTGSDLTNTRGVWYTSMIGNSSSHHILADNSWDASTATPGAFISGAGNPRIINGNTNAKNRPGRYVAGDTTPSVFGADSMYIANSGATTITQLDDGEDGQIVSLLFADANTTLANSNFYLSGGINFTSTAHDTLTLVKKPNTSFWYEVSRSLNS